MRRGSTVRFERWFTEPEAVFAEVARFLDTDVRPDRVRIDPAQAHDPRDAETLALLRRHCHTAEALGYPIAE